MNTEGNNEHTGPDTTPTGRYAIRVAGHLAARWGTRFDGLTLTHQADGTTLLEGPIADQAALHGLLLQVRDLGLSLVSVSRTASN